MYPNEIIAVMKSKGMLRQEPRNSREKITSAVQYMLVKTGMKSVELLDELPGVRSTHYMRRKILDSRWKVGDLDRLAETFDLNPGDFVFGYRHLAEMDEEENE